MGIDIPGIAANQASLWTTYRFAAGVLDGLTLGGGVRYVGESWGDTLNTITVPSLFPPAVGTLL